MFICTKHPLTDTISLRKRHIITFTEYLVRRDPNLNLKIQIKLTNEKTPNALARQKRIHSSIPKTDLRSCCDELFAVRFYLRPFLISNSLLKNEKSRKL